MGRIFFLVNDLGISWKFLRDKSEIQPLPHTICEHNLNCILYLQKVSLKLIKENTSRCVCNFVGDFLGLKSPKEQLQKNRLYQNEKFQIIKNTFKMKLWTTFWGEILHITNIWQKWSRWSTSYQQFITYLMYLSSVKYLSLCPSFYHLSSIHKSVMKVK